MAGVVADSVVVEVLARKEQYERDMDALVRKTETAFKKMRKAAEAPVVAKLGKSTADTTAEVVAVEKAETKKRTAKKKTVDDAAKDDGRLAAVAQRAVDRDNAATVAIERNANRRTAAYDRELAKRQSALMSTTALRGTQPAPDRGLTFGDVRSDITANRGGLLALSAAGDKAATQALKDQQLALRLVNQYKAQGLSASQAQARAEKQVADIVKRRADDEARATAAARRAAIVSADKRVSGGAVSVVRGAAGFLGVASAAIAAKEFLEIADASKKLDAQLRLATDGFGSFSQAQTDVRRISAETRSDINATAKLYSNFTRNAKELGITQVEAARATETVAKAFAISGSSTVEAAQATRQLVQGLQSGTLRGDELNSVLEAAPRLSRLLADSLGITVGELRKLGEEGKLTSKALTEAFTNKKFTTALDDEFRQLPVTFEQAMGQVYNAAVITFGGFDRGGEFSKAISEFVLNGADDFKSLEKSAEDLGASIRSTFAGLTDAFSPMVEGALAAFEKIGGGAFDLQGFIRSTLKEADALLNIGPNIANRFGAGGQFNSDLLGTYDKSRQQTLNRLQGQNNQRRFDAMNSGYDVLGNPLPGTPTGARPKGSPSIQSASDSKRAESAARKAAREAEKAAREQARDEAQDRQIQIEILRAKQALAGTVELRSEFELEALAIEKAQRIADVKNDKTLSDQKMADGKSERERRLEYIAKLYGPINNNMNEASVGAGGLLPRAVSQDANREIARRIADNADRLDNIKQDELQDELDMATTRKDRARIQNELLELELKQRQRALELELSQTTDADKQSAIRAEIASLGGARERGQASIARANEGPLAQYNRSLNGDPTELAEQFVVDQLKAVQDGITGALQNAIGVKDPIIGSLLNILVQEVIMKPLAQALASANGGSAGGGVGSFLSSIGEAVFGGARADGGNVTAGKIYRINERGPEFFQPGLSGKIIPTGRANSINTGGGTTIVQQTVKVDARNSVNPDGFARQILAVSARQASNAAASVGKSVYQAIPQRLNEYQKDGT